MLIELTTAEVQMATIIGVQRQIEDIKWENHGKYKSERHLAWQRHIEGALAECALAKFLNVYWSKGKHDQPDVGKVDVRTTHHENGKLTLHKEDKDDRKYYLLTGLNGKYMIRGWLLGKAGKQEKFWSDPTGKDRWAYFVPQEFLNKVDELDGG